MHLSQQNKLTKEDILSHRESIGELFHKGSSFVSYPLRATVLFKPHNEQTEHCAGKLKCLFVVSKRYHRRAVKRNLLRRRIKEAHRLSRVELLEMLSINSSHGTIHLAINYITSESHNYQTIADALAKIHQRLVDMASSETH